MFGLFKKNNDDLTNTELAIRCFKAGRFKEALRRANAIIEFAPDVALSHRFKGEVLFEMGKYADCQDSFLQAEKLGGPGTEECFFWRALAAANGGNPQKGIEILEAYINLAEANPSLVEKCYAAINRLRHS